MGEGTLKLFGRAFKNIPAALCFSLTSEDFSKIVGFSYIFLSKYFFESIFIKDWFAQGPGLRLDSSEAGCLHYEPVALPPTWPVCRSGLAVPLPPAKVSAAGPGKNGNAGTVSSLPFSRSPGDVTCADRFPDCWRDGGFEECTHAGSSGRRSRSNCPR